MKKILITLMLSLLTLTNVQAQEAKIDEQVLKHVNPMPNLMRVVAKYKVELGLTEQQLTAIDLWKKANKPRMKKLVGQILDEEKKLHTMALETDGHMVAQAQKMLNIRKNLIILKAQCRANLKTFVSKEQWAKLIEFYKKENGLS